MDSDLRVSSDEYKVLSLKKAILYYFAFLSLAAAIYYSASAIFEDTKNFHIIVYALLWTFKLAIAVWACLFGYRVIQNKQSPPPDSWVIEKWKVYKGQRAYRIGWLMIFLGVFIGALAAYSGYLLMRIVNVAG